MNEALKVDYRNQGNTEEFDYHSHQEYEIYFFHAGSCRYLIHNQIYDLEPGDILLMDGMTLHKPNVRPNSEYIRSVIHFSPFWIKGLLKELNSMDVLESFQNRHHCLIRTKRTEKLERIEGNIRQLSEILHTPAEATFYKDAKMKLLLAQTLITLRKLVTTEITISSDGKPEKAQHIENIVKYIQASYMKDIRLNDIAESLNLSKSYMSHLFKEMTGFTIMEYVMGCRLTQVKYLLEMKPEARLKEIAHQSGFKSTAHFSRYFREQTGMTASEYRQMRLTNIRK